MGEERHHGFDETELINLLNRQKERMRELGCLEEDEEKEKRAFGSHNREKGFEFEREI